MKDMRQPPRTRALGPQPRRSCLPSHVPSRDSGSSSGSSLDPPRPLFPLKDRPGVGPLSRGHASLTAASGCLVARWSQCVAQGETPGSPSLKGQPQSVPQVQPSALPLQAPGQEAQCTRGQREHCGAGARGLSLLSALGEQPCGTCALAKDTAGPDHQPVGGRDRGSEGRPTRGQQEA